MGRVLMFLLVAGALVLLYVGVLAGGDAEARDEAGATLAGARPAGAEGAATQGSSGSPSAARPLRASASPQDGPRRSASPLRRLIAGVSAGEVEAVERAYRALARSGGEARQQLARAVRQAAESADGARELVALLGRANAFLHSDAGRRVARRAIARARALEPQQTARTLTRILESCMRGEIARADVEAKAVVDEAYEALRVALRRSVLDPARRGRARTYRVKPGDALAKIARGLRKQGYPVEAGTLALVNRVTDPRRLQVGQVLKVPVDEIHTVVEKHSFLMAVYLGDVIIRLYWIGHGKEGRTPETTFTVGVKKKHPDWYAEGRVIPYGHPDNVLGDYFVKFDHPSYTGFGAHGTPDPDSIGATVSRGCLRLRDEDIEEFFQIVPRGSKIEIRASR